MCSKYGIYSESDTQWNTERSCLIAKTYHVYYGHEAFYDMSLFFPTKIIRE